MAIYNFDPAGSFSHMARKANQFFNDFEKGISFEIGGYAPRVDIHENEKQVYLYAEMPGVRKEDLKVSINDENVLLIKGEKNKPQYEAGNQVSTVKSERAFGQFARSFALPENINGESIDANYENGILTIILDKKEPEKPKEIKVEIK